MNSNPFYPELSEEAKKEAELILSEFRNKLKKLADEALTDLYINCIYYIESDSWSNFRNQLLDGFRNYNNDKIHAQYDFAQIRKEIYKEHHDELVKDLNQDLVKENEDLKKRISQLEELRRSIY